MRGGGGELFVIAVHPGGDNFQDDDVLIQILFLRCAGIYNLPSLYSFTSY